MKYSSLGPDRIVPVAVEAVTPEAEHSQDFSVFGKRVQETGLTYYRARCYDSEIGRFLSEDPVDGLNPPCPWPA